MLKVVLIILELRQEEYLRVGSAGTRSKRGLIFSLSSARHVSSLGYPQLSNVLGRKASFGAGSVVSKGINRAPG